MAEAGRYVVGIDLGTTNSAVAYIDLAEARAGRGAVQTLGIAQLVGPGEAEARPLLPSVVYLPAAHERLDGTLQLPFGPQTSQVLHVVGELARARGAQVPGRAVTSAKSWLCHGAVDRRSAILPPGAARDVERLSPVAASAHVLTHVRDVWTHQHPDAPLALQKVVLTVPASFDATARALTLEAARQAGLGDGLVLVEEPMAAFYDYWATQVAQGRVPASGLTLVVDVGGGTTDLTLIRSTPDADGTPALERLAVGRHILLGGDNMDMALARLAEGKLDIPGGRLDPARWGQLVQSCRMAKEALLAGDDGPDAYRVLVAGRGSRLLGGSLACDLGGDEVRAAVLDGFLPVVDPADRPRRPARAALAQLGLPYEPDPAITRHVAAFLAAHGDPETGAPARPDAVLLNGGVFESPLTRERLLAVLRVLGAEPTLLPHGSLSEAVARGAVTYGLVREGIGHRIGGGSGHAYYVEVAAEGDARRAVCLVPRGHEVGVPVALTDRTFSLVVGRPVQFQLFATSADRRDRPGDVVTPDEDTFDRTAPLQVRLPSADGAQEIPVVLHAQLTEVGALDVFATAVDREGTWHLELDVRGSGAAPRVLVMPGDVGGGAKGLTGKQREAATQRVNRIFGKSRKPVDPREARTLRDDLQAALGMKKEDWSLAMLRDLWEILESGATRRRRTAHHEATYLNLAGYFLRPGFGHTLDEWRVQELWKVYQEGVQYHHEHKVWQAWWVCWRRVVGGLDADQQRVLEKAVLPWLRPELVPGKRGKVEAGGTQEMLRLVAVLERLDPIRKAAWGDWLLEQIEQEKDLGVVGWSLARVGARVPFSGAVHHVVDPEIVDGWLTRLLRLKWKKVPQAAFAAAHLARRTDDRHRDVEEDLRQRTASQLEKMGFTDLAPMVRDVVHLEAEAEATFAGDSLPPGLVLRD